MSRGLNFSPDEARKLGLVQIDGEWIQLRRPGSARSGPCPIVQEQEAINHHHQRGGKARRKKRNGEENEGLDEGSHPKFRITVTVRYSDKRIRDCSGALETILDCIVTAAKEVVKDLPHAKDFVFLDDSRFWVPEQHVFAEEVSPGEEGALIKIERIYES